MTNIGSDILVINPGVNSILSSKSDHGPYIIQRERHMVFTSQTEISNGFLLQRALIRKKVFKCKLLLLSQTQRSSPF